jgi:hypothetical protein
MSRLTGWDIVEEIQLYAGLESRLLIEPEGFFQFLATPASHSDSPCLWRSFGQRILGSAHRDGKTEIRPNARTETLVRATGIRRYAQRSIDSDTTFMIEETRLDRFSRTVEAPLRAHCQFP